MRDSRIMATETIEHEGPTWARLVDQLGWYERNAKKNQQSYKALKLLQIILGALVPVVAAASGSSRVLLAALGAGVVVIEAIQQLFQFHRNWIAYRSTAEALKREQHLFEVGGGDYAGAPDRTVLLAERLEALISRETGEWASLETTSQKKPAG
jgi:Protein of unknown function (DUF4231)